MFFLPSMFLAAQDAWVANFGTEEISILSSYSVNSDVAFAILMGWMTTELTFWTMTLSFYYIQSRGYFQKYKIHQGKSRDAQKQDEVKDMAQFRETLREKPLTYLVDVPLYWLSYRMTGMWSSAALSSLDALPAWDTLLVHVIANLVVFDFLFYAWHRFLHSPSMWRFHKKHHEVKITYAAANEHEDWLEVTGNIAWKMIPPAIFGTHVYAVCVFRSVVKCFALLHHSGYELPIFTPIQNFPFISSPTDHDFHHFHGHGNYGGVFMLWDYLGGSYISYEDKARHTLNRKLTKLGGEGREKKLRVLMQILEAESGVSVNGNATAAKTPSKTIDSDGVEANGVRKRRVYKKELADGLSKMAEQGLIDSIFTSLSSQEMIALSDYRCEDCFDRALKIVEARNAKFIIPEALRRPLSRRLVSAAA